MASPGACHDHAEEQYTYFKCTVCEKLSNLGQALGATMTLKENWLIKLWRLFWYGRCCLPTCIDPSGSVSPGLPGPLFWFEACLYFGCCHGQRAPLLRRAHVSLSSSSCFLITILFSWSSGSSTSIVNQSTSLFTRTDASLQHHQS